MTWLAPGAVCGSHVDEHAKGRESLVVNCKRGGDGVSVQVARGGAEIALGLFAESNFFCSLPKGKKSLETLLRVGVCVALTALLSAS